MHSVKIELQNMNHFFNLTILPFITPSSFSNVVRYKHLLEASTVHFIYDFLGNLPLYHSYFLQEFENDKYQICCHKLEITFSLLYPKITPSIFTVDQEGSALSST